MNNDKLFDIIEPAVAAVEFSLYGVEYIPQGKFSLLRVYIDSPNGVTLDECAIASRQISAVLDVEDPINGKYNLEVSSPGMERPLFKAEHYAEQVGKVIKLSVYTPIDNRRTFEGEVVSANEEAVTLTVDEETLTFDLSDVVKAHVVYKV
tara:strand:- start:33361 stop:33810 length:450 start_codon:yes stop_codon:yes gene_type:complete